MGVLKVPNQVAPRALISAAFYPPHVGGIERFSANVAAELVHRGWEVDILSCAEHPEGAFRLGASGERVYELSSRVVASRLPVPVPSRRNRKILQALRSNDYSLVLIQSHLYINGLLAAGLARGTRSVWLNLGSGHVPAGNPLLSALVAGYEHVVARLLRPKVATVAGVSLESAAWLEHLGVRHAFSVGNAATSVAKPRNGREPGPLRVIYAGRLEPGKGADEAIHIVKDAGREHPIHLTICGDGSQRPLIESLLGADSAEIDFCGAVPHDELLARMRTADVFICPSRYPEGFPTVLLDAGAQGCAILTYPIGGTAELLSGGGGWRVADRAEAVAALSAAAASPSEVTEVGETLRRSVAERFTWQRIVSRLLGDDLDT